MRHVGRLPVRQDPEYLRNQSRYVHALHRRNRRFSRAFFFLAFAFLIGLLGAALLDLTFALGWGYGWQDVRDTLLVIGAAILFWIFSRLIQKLLLAFTRHTYGPDPGQPHFGDTSLISKPPDRPGAPQ